MGYKNLPDDPKASFTYRGYKAVYASWTWRGGLKDGYEVYGRNEQVGKVPYIQAIAIMNAWKAGKDPITEGALLEGMSKEQLILQHKSGAFQEESKLRPDIKKAVLKYTDRENAPSVGTVGKLAAAPLILIGVAILVLWYFLLGKQRG